MPRGSNSVEGPLLFAVLIAIVLLVGIGVRAIAIELMHMVKQRQGVYSPEAEYMTALVSYLDARTDDLNPENAIHLADASSSLSVAAAARLQRRGRNQVAPSQSSGTKRGIALSAFESSSISTSDSSEA